jgi:hypothetical protein
MILDFEKFIKEKVGDAIESSFMDATIFGTGYIKITFINNDLDIKHIAFDKVEEELEELKEFKKNMKTNYEC